MRHILIQARKLPVLTILTVGIVFLLLTLNDIPSTPDHIYDLFSISNSLGSLAILGFVSSTYFSITFCGIATALPITYSFTLLFNGLVPLSKGSYGVEIHFPVFLVGIFLSLISILSLIIMSLSDSIDVINVDTFAMNDLVKYESTYSELLVGGNNEEETNIIDDCDTLNSFYTPNASLNSGNHEEDALSANNSYDVDLEKDIEDNTHENLNPIQEIRDIKEVKCILGGVFLSIISAVCLAFCNFHYKNVRAVEYYFNVGISCVVLSFLMVLFFYCNFGHFESYNPTVSILNGRHYFPIYIFKRSLVKKAVSNFNEILNGLLISCYFYTFQWLELEKDRFSLILHASASAFGTFLLTLFYLIRNLRNNNFGMYKNKRARTSFEIFHFLERTRIKKPKLLNPNIITFLFYTLFTFSAYGGSFAVAYYGIRAE
jgi:hypothetical protein